MPEVSAFVEADPPEGTGFSFEESWFVQSFLETIR